MAFIWQDHDLTLNTQVVPFICEDQARILSFLMFEEFHAFATERRSMSRVLESFEIAVEGNTGKNWGVSRAMYHSLNEMESLALESSDQRLQLFRAVSALWSHCIRTFSLKSKLCNSFRSSSRYIFNNLSSI